MRVAKLVALLGVLAMGGILLYAFTQGDFAGEGSELLSMPWGIVSLSSLDGLSIVSDRLSAPWCGWL